MSFAFASRRRSPTRWPRLRECRVTPDRGEFRRAELGALDAETYALVIGLMDSFEAGVFERAQWESAAESAQAAELGACA